MNELIPVRLSHLLRHCSVGSIVRGADYLMTVKDIREWTDKGGANASRPIPYVERVRSALNVDQELREPPLAREREKGKGVVEGTCIPAIRFPFWMRCPACGLMHYKPWRQLEGNTKPRCCETNKVKCPKSPELEQTPWVMVHQEGYLADVPWHYLAHKNARGMDQEGCKADFAGHYLRLIQEKSGGAYTLKCHRCKAQAGFQAQMTLPYGSSTPLQPWLKITPEETPDEPAQIMGINDTRIHSPTTDNALVIPPESRIRKGTIEDRLYCSSENRKQIEQARNGLARKSAFRRLATHLSCSPAEIEQAWIAISSGQYPPPHDSSMTTGQLLEDEYQALLDETPDYFDDEDFVARHKTTEWKDLHQQLELDSRSALIVRSISRLIAVNRLKEIQVFKGFSRANGSSENLVPPDIDNHSGWLPAIELYGEGVFLTLDEPALKKWESQDVVKNRAEVINSRFERTGIQFDHEFVVTPRFLLLHTIAHIIIRQLETIAGYPAASLKERIYCKSGHGSMAGILVYVAIPDIIGSLGGLAELAEPKRILSLMTSVFDQAEWCSLDPVCSEHDGQGPQLLNRAACHACALVPEPSCAYGNVLLDRTFIRGDICGNLPSFLQCVELMDGRK
jgi:hypothetical protein